ncbi:MAG: hypothetical protein WC683_06490 [bacterium]
MIGAGEGIKPIVQDFLRDDARLSIMDRYPLFQYEYKDDYRRDYYSLDAEFGHNSELDDLDAESDRVQFTRMGRSILLFFHGHAKILGQMRSFVVNDNNANGLIDTGDDVYIYMGIQKRHTPYGDTLVAVKCEDSWIRGWTCSEQRIIEPVQKAYTSALKMLGLVE